MEENGKIIKEIFKDDRDSNEKFKVLPNPAREYLQILVSNVTQVKEIILYDQLGGKLRQLRLGNSSNNINLDIRGLRTGQYFLSIFDGERWNTKKVIITP